MTKWQKMYPPYEGDEPYLYFAFADGDTRKVWRIMKILLSRGCRVWYCIGTAGNSQELFHRQARASGAELTLLYMTDILEGDKDSKTRIMVNQKNQKPILCLNADGKNHNLAMDIHESTPSIPLYQIKNDGELESALIRASGFTQSMFGKPAVVTGNWMTKLTVVFLLLAVLLIGGSTLYFRQEYTHHDTIVFSDPVILAAARASAGGGDLTETSVGQIQRIRLTEIPESWTDLALFTDLETIELPQHAVTQDACLPEGNYRIVLYGGVS